MPESLNDAGKPKSYVLVLDCSSKSLESGKNSIINIAASTHIELFQALRVWQGVRLRSFTGAIRAVFSPWSVRVKLDWVCLVSPHHEVMVQATYFMADPV
jgi:hypothetical protein